LFDDFVFQRSREDIKHDVTGYAVVHGLYDGWTLHVYFFTKGALLEEVPDFRGENTELAGEFQVADNQFGIVTDNFLGALHVFDSVFSFK
jgi:hypothetical protein